MYFMCYHVLKIHHQFGDDNKLNIAVKTSLFS